jgi:hypothetical protein
LNEKRADNAEELWLSRCNSDYGCYAIEVWSKNDIKYMKDLESK